MAKTRSRTTRPSTRPANRSPKRAASGKSGTTRPKATPGKAPRRSSTAAAAPAEAARKVASPVIPGRGKNLPAETVGGIEPSTDEEIREAGREGVAGVPRQEVSGTNPATGQITEVETTQAPPPTGDGQTSTKSTK